MRELWRFRWLCGRLRYKYMKEPSEVKLEHLMERLRQGLRLGNLIVAELKLIHEVDMVNTGLLSTLLPVHEENDVLLPTLQQSLS